MFLPEFIKKSECLPELARPVCGSEYVAQRNRVLKLNNKGISKRATGLSWLQPTYSFLATGDAQHHESEHILQTSNGDHTGIVFELYIAIAIFC